MRGREHAWRIAMLLGALAANGLGAQQPVDSVARARIAHDSLARCDSIVGASRVDSVDAALFISVRRSDGRPLGPEQTSALESNIGAAFVAPRPFKLTVFAGPALIPALSLAAAAAPVLRSPTVTGTYRLSSDSAGVASQPIVVRAALAPGFDSAAMRAIEDLSALHSLFLPPRGAASMRIDVRWSTDSLPGALRLVSMHFPRMPVVDASPVRPVPAPAFPDAARGDSLTSGQVVLRVVIDPSGAPRLDAVEAVRATSVDFVRAALESLVAQRFHPATIGGCAVPQLVDYPVSFVLPEPPAPRH
ncbi:MAG TPA: energy transducer TonB [Gemmatimonadaceae bacterium]|nr:energy transducer TonB [Gemmatimonadaceae bacterium]